KKAAQKLPQSLATPSQISDIAPRLSLKSAQSLQPSSAHRRKTKPHAHLASAQTPEGLDAKSRNRISLHPNPAQRPRVAAPAYAPGPTLEIPDETPPSPRRRPPSRAAPAPPA